MLLIHIPYHRVRWRQSSTWTLSHGKLRVSSQVLVREIEYAETARPHMHTAIVRAYSFSMTLGYQRVNGAVLPTSMCHHGPSEPLVKPVEYSAFALNNVRAYSIYNMGCIILATTNHQ